MKYCTNVIVCTAILLALAPVAAFGIPEYSVQPVPSSDSTFYAFQPRTINATGSVSGTGARTSPSAGRALVYTPGAGFFTPHLSSAYPYSHGAMVGDNGDIAFTYDGMGNSGLGGDQSVARWSAATGVTNFGRVLPNAVSAQVNTMNGSRIAGYAYFQNYIQGFCIGCGSNGSTIATGSFSPGDINVSGVMTGSGPGPTSYGVAIYANGQMVMLNGLLPDGGPNSVGAAINDNGEVAAYSQVQRSFPGFYRHAFLVSPSGAIDLGALGDDHQSVYPTDLNNSRVVVGYAFTEVNPTSQYTAWVWDQTHGIRDLNTLVPQNSVNGRLTFAYSINNSGQILVYADPNNGHDGTYYVLTPDSGATPTPTVTPSPTATSVPTIMPTFTPTSTVTPTRTATRTPTRTPVPCTAATRKTLAQDSLNMKQVSPDSMDSLLTRGDCVKPTVPVPTVTPTFTPPPTFWPTVPATYTPTPTVTPGGGAGGTLPWPVDGNSDR